MKQIYDNKGFKIRVATVEELEQKYILVPDDVSCEQWKEVVWVYMLCLVGFVCLFVCLL